jgi:hypothetical protein
MHEIKALDSVENVKNIMENNAPSLQFSVCDVRIWSVITTERVIAMRSARRNRVKDA